VERRVTVAPEVLGKDIALDGDDAGDPVGAGAFTVITPSIDRAAAALTRVAPRLMDVDEHGNVVAPGEVPTDEAYTPNFVFDPEVCHFGAMVKLDTKGVMWSAMGRTMVGMIVDALVADGIPAHITGYRADLRGEWRVWQPPDAHDSPAGR
jgi:hypothetical protein